MNDVVGSPSGLWIDTQGSGYVNFRYITSVKWDRPRAMLRISMVNGDVAYTLRFNDAEDPARAFLDLVNIAAFESFGDNMETKSATPQD